MQKWKGYGKQIRSAYSFSAVGLEMGLAVAVGYLLGDWLDGAAGTSPFGMIGGVLIGSAAAFLGLYRSLKRLERQADGDGDST